MKAISILFSLLILFNCLSCSNARWTAPGGKASEERKAIEEKIRSYQAENPHLSAADLNAKLNAIRKEAAAAKAETDRKIYERNLENAQDPLKVSLF
jgi:predicted  nucleic acid-binding Zn-ribbon protein